MARRRRKSHALWLEALERRQLLDTEAAKVLAAHAIHFEPGRHARPQTETHHHGAAGPKTAEHHSHSSDAAESPRHSHPKLATKHHHITPTPDQRAKGVTAKTQTGVAPLTSSPVVATPSNSVAGNTLSATSPPVYIRPLGSPTPTISVSDWYASGPTSADV